MAFEDNQQLIRIFEEIGHYLELQDENPFKVKAYQRAARALEGLERSVGELYRAGQLADLAGFGKALVEKVGQFLETGQVDLHQRLQAEFPPHILQLMDVPGLGAKKAAILYRELKVGSLEDLESVLREGLVRDLKGFGQRTEEKLLEGLAHLRQGEQRWLLGQARRLADHLLGELRALPFVQRAEAAGSLRRGKETVGDLDLLVITSEPAEVMRFFTSLVSGPDILMQGPTKSSIRWEGRFQVDLRCLEAASFGAAMQYFTGSKDHNVALRARAEKLSLKLNEYGLFDALGQSLAGEREEDIYRVLGLDCIPPELREGQDLEAPPRVLVEASHLLGNLHTHSLWSDGSDTLEQLAQEARSRGYRYLAITDHSRSMVVANGLTVDRLLEQGEAIRRINQQYTDFCLLWGSECDILGDGSLDFPDEVLALLDFVVVAVHSQFQMPPEQMTRRICKALSHPQVDVLAHPSGRLLGRRPGYQADWDEIFRTACAHGVALEINGSENRMDLSDLSARRAHDLGCQLSLGTDAHCLREFDNLSLALTVARRAGLPPEALLNTRTADQLRSRRARPSPC